jgi:hypothetical protein
MALRQSDPPSRLRASARQGCQASGVMLNSRTEIALPKQGPTDGADSMPEYRLIFRSGPCAPQECGMTVFGA